MRHAKQFEVHGQLHVLPGCSAKVITLSGQNVCEKAWRHIFAVSKTTFYRNRSEFKNDMRPRDHENLNMKRSRTSTQQATATLSTILEDKANMMPHKARTLPNGSRVVEMVLPRGTKWKKFLGTINEVRSLLIQNTRIVCVDETFIWEWFVTAQLMNMNGQL
jgi:hypothetical protein